MSPGNQIISLNINCHDVRVFAASSIDRFPDAENVIQELSSIKGCRPVKTPQLHLTFRFFGELAEKDLEVTRTEFQKITGKKYSLRIEGLDAFPKLATANVIFLRVENNQELTSIWEKIASIPPHSKKMEEFVPHITLARLGNSRDLRELAKSYGTIRYSESMDRITLYSSKLERNGPVYAEIEQIQLK